MMRTREVSGQIWYILLHSVISFFGRVPGLLDIYIYIYGFRDGSHVFGILDFSTLGIGYCILTEHCGRQHYGREYIWYEISRLCY